MDKRVISAIGILILFLVVSGCALISTGYAETDRITAKQLKEMLDRPDVIVVDVRAGSDWKKSESKIKGAVREDLSAISEWMDKYPRDKTLVFYCA